MLGLPITVFGDVMLDVYSHCTPVRVSSEAPVLIVRQESETLAPGGAGNVAANILVGFGMDVELVGVISGDNIGCKLIECLNEYPIGHKFMVEAGYWKTIEKRRFVDTLGRQMLRVDIEGSLTQHAKLSIPTTMNLRVSLAELATRSSTLVVSDYNKGTCTPELIHYAISEFGRRDRYVVVNGKPENFLYYKGADIIIFNLSEAEAVAQTYIGGWNGTDLISLPGMLREHLSRYGKAPDVLVTLGDRGMNYWGKDGPYHVDAPEVKVADVAGAGDTITATIAAMGRCDQRVMEVAAKLAADVVSQHGTSLCQYKLTMAEVDML